MRFASKTAPRCRAARHSALGGLSSVLRLAARDRQAQPASPAWLAGLTRAMRAAGSAAAARPLGTVGEFAPSEWLAAR